MEQTTHESFLDRFLLTEHLLPSLICSQHRDVEAISCFFQRLPLAYSHLFLQACDVSVDRAADQLSTCKYLVTR